MFCACSVTRCCDLIGVQLLVGFVAGIILIHIFCHEMKSITFLATLKDCGSPEHSYVENYFIPHKTFNEI